MPATAKDSTLLISGGSGFIGAWTCYYALAQGHKVRTTVRSQEKGEYLQKVFEKYSDKFTFVIAEDLEKDGVFDEAVKDVDAVLHTASPFHFETSGDPQKTLIQPAVNGTTNILRSIKKNGSQVQRVVITSSFAAILDSSVSAPTRFTEKDWNTSDPKAVETEKEKQSGMSAYRASKTLAERAAWEWFEKEKPSFDLVTINPPLVLGPIIHEVHSAEKLNTSVGQVWSALHGGKKDADLSAAAGSWVDVRDVAKAHVEAAVQEKAGGQRFGTSNGAWAWQDVADVVHNAPAGAVPDEWKSSLPVGTPGKRQEGNWLDGSKATKELGIKYFDLTTTILDTIHSLVDYEKRDWKGLPDGKFFTQ